MRPYLYESYDLDFLSSEYFVPDTIRFESCNALSPGLFWLAMSKPVKRKEPVIVDGECAGPAVCPLSHVKAGTVVCIKHLSGAPEIRVRLREMGFGEKQIVKLLSKQSNLICQVCNARLGISEQLAETILVEPLHADTKAA